MARFHKWERETNHNLPNRISWKHAYRGAQTAQKQRPYVVLQQTSISWTEKVCDSMWEELQIKDKAPLYAQMYFIISVRWLHCCNALCFVDNFSFFAYASWFFYKLIRRKMFQMKNYHKKQNKLLKYVLYQWTTIWVPIPEGSWSIFWRGREYIFYVHSCITFASFEF